LETRLVEGDTIAVERMDPDCHLDRLSSLAADLVRSKPDLIVAFTAAAVRAAKNATEPVPVI
jgi:putative ABC transport system substrate-binding protein